MYERNAARSALGAAAAHRRARAAQRRRRTRSSRTPTSSCCSRGAATASSAASRRSTIACTTRRTATTPRCSDSSRPPTPRPRGALLAARRSAGRGARPRARARTDQPVAERERGLLVDGFDTDPMLMMPHNPPEYAAQIESAGYREGEGSVRLAATTSQRDLPPAFVAKLARRLRDKHGIIVRPLNLGGVHARGRAAARALLRRRGSATGDSCRRPTPNSAGSPPS